MKRWGPILAMALLLTGCADRLTYEEFAECMDAAMPIGREDVANGAEQDDVVRDMMAVCGYDELSDEERAKIPG